MLRRPMRRARAFCCSVLAALALAACFPDIPEPLSEPRPSGPVLFLSPAEAQAIQEHVGEEPWQSAASALDTTAAEAYAQAPRSVVDDGAPKSGSANEFATDSPSLPTSTRHDYLAAADMAAWMRRLALSYAIRGNEDHGRRTIELLEHWFVSPATRMLPIGSNNGPHELTESGSDLEVWLTIPPMLYAATLTWNHPAWAERAAARAELRAWAEAFRVSVETVDGQTGSHRAWWLLARASAAVFADASASRNAAYADWRTMVETVDGSGLFAGAGTDLGGSLFLLKPLALLADLGEHNAGALWDFDGGLERAADKHAAALLDPQTWPGTTDLDTYDRDESEAVFELFYSRWQKPAYLSVLGAPDPVRPHDEPRVLGPVTLTHGERFRLSGGGP